MSLLNDIAGTVGEGGDTLSSEKQGGRNLEIDLDNCIFEGKIYEIQWKQERRSPPYPLGA